MQVCKWTGKMFVKLINHLRVGHFADGESDALSWRRVQKLSRLKCHQHLVSWNFYVVDLHQRGCDNWVKLEKSFEDRLQCDLITNMYTWSENSCGVSAVASYRSVLFSFFFSFLLLRLLASQTGCSTLYVQRRYAKLLSVKRVHNRWQIFNLIRLPVFDSFNSQSSQANKG